MVPGYESANARMLPDGSVIIHVGTHNHGQGHETTFAQIAAHELTIIPALISIRYGDTATAPFGFGTLRLALHRVRRRRGGAVLPHADRKNPEDRRASAADRHRPERMSRPGAVHGPAGSVSFAEIAYAANVRQEHLPAGMEPLLDVTGTYEPTETGGVFAYGTHAVVVAVEPDTGVVEILDYAVSEDCGTMINPMIVDGQVQGGIAQGIGTALYEEIPYDEIGQPLATTFGDYMVPCAPEIPDGAGRASGASGAGHRIRRQRPRRRRRHRAAGGHRQRGGRRVPRHRRKLQRDAADAAPGVGGGRSRPPQPRADWPERPVPA